MSNWTTSKIPSVKGKVFIVTGANSGLGLGIAKALAQKKAHVVMTARNMEKGKKALKEIKSETPDASVDLLELDLADLSSIKKFADTFKRKYKKLDVLINNAGVMTPKKRQETTDGFEVQFGTNHLGHFTLTANLLAPLKATPGSRVVTMSSMAAKMKNADIYWDDIQWEKNYDKSAAYAQSKLANQMFALELQKWFDKENFDTISVLAHPGYTKTNLQRHTGILGTVGYLFLAQNVNKGMLPALEAATDKKVSAGDYYGPDGWKEIKGYPEKVSVNEKANNPEARQKLWKLSEELTDTTIFKNWPKVD